MVKLNHWHIGRAIALFTSFCALSAQDLTTSERRVTTTAEWCRRACELYASRHSSVICGLQLVSFGFHVFMASVKNGTVRLEDRLTFYFHRSYHFGGGLGIETQANAVLGAYSRGFSSSVRQESETRVRLVASVRLVYTLCFSKSNQIKIREDVMGKTFLSLFLLAGSLFAADPFVGTWKLNAAKSKISKHEGGPPPAKELTVIIAVVDGQIIVTSTGTSVDGSPISMKTTAPRTGGPVQFLEGGPPPGSGITSTQAKTKADSHTIEATNEKDGKVYETMRAVVSADGKSVRAITKGTDPQGKKYGDVEVYDKQ